jgi:hypothetical protein
MRTLPVVALVLIGIVSNRALAETDSAEGQQLFVSACSVAPGIAGQRNQVLRGYLYDHYGGWADDPVLGDTENLHCRKKR